MVGVTKEVKVLTEQIWRAYTSARATPRAFDINITHAPDMKRETKSIIRAKNEVLI